MGSSNQPPVISTPPAVPAPAKSSLTNVQRTGTSIVVALIVAAIYYAGTRKEWCATESWLLTLGLLVVLCIYLGWVISGRPLGILVGSRNLMSLSRFQMVAWTIVILSAFLTIAFRRILGGVANPLDIVIDQHLWALLGISTASLVGTPLILQNKTGKDTDQATVAKTAIATGETAQQVDDNRQGNLYANPSITDARVTDMFEGDEVGNTAYIDIAKVQMFLFTIIIIVAFCYQVYGMLCDFCKTGNIAALVMPVLSPGLIALLGISHAGYLGSKTADHTPVSPPTNG